MFEISGDDITYLGDSDLRSLVSRLAIAELRSKGYPLSSVTAGGKQDAPDGGIDVRVECPLEITDPDFVPRKLTVFQVKKPDMPRSAIFKEMRPNGILRNAIRDLAEASGAYVLVSSQGTLTDTALIDRRNAMREALEDLITASKLETDFYDRDRIATWVNIYPGVAAWVRSKVGRPLSGWSGIDDWEGGKRTSSKTYLFDEKACLTNEYSHNRKSLSIPEGIAYLRGSLSKPRQCIRLIGLSGIGKTRLVQALFERGIGNDPLDSSIAVYTDYSQETNPTARDMARALIAHSQRAILIIDNCNPSIHSELARICACEKSQVSLITIEYDVGEDEPEHTDVFRLQSSSAEILNAWVKQCFPNISHIDCERITDFSDGNFRVASALADTVSKGETLGSLKDRDLFERIFRQRNEPDRLLLHAAEDLSLLYSVDGEDISKESELARIGIIRGINPTNLYQALVEMRQRGVVQARGVFRAVLPQAIANRLATYALDRIHPTQFDQFCNTLTPRMLKSVSRRLGFLHDSSAAKATVERWLHLDGPLGDLLEKGEDSLQIISSITPVAPELVLARLEHSLGIAESHQTYNFKSRQLIHLIKGIGYDADLFDRAVLLLSHFVEPERIGNDFCSGLNAFSQLFHIYLSGTQATPEQRRSTIRRLSSSENTSSYRCAKIALTALLKTGTFMSVDSHSFGARSRDWGWEPKTQEDICSWYEEAIKLVIELTSEEEARTLLSTELRQLWQFPGCRNALKNAAEIFIRTRPWIEGWIASRAALRFDGNNMTEDSRSELKQLIERLKPKDILNQARAVIFNRMSSSGGWDFEDGEDDEGDPIRSWEKVDRMARNIGCEMANNDLIRSNFLSELLVTPNSFRSFHFGSGLAAGSTNLHSLWSELIETFGAANSQMRNANVLGGFICEANQRDPSFTANELENSLKNPDLLPVLPFLQIWAGLNDEGILRLRRAIAKGGVKAKDFHCLAGGCVLSSPPKLLAELLEDIASLTDGVEMALSILHMHFNPSQNELIDRDSTLISVGRDLLRRVEFGRDKVFSDYEMQTVIRICLKGEDGRITAERLCFNMRSSFSRNAFLSNKYNYTISSLFNIHPIVALDNFLLPREEHEDSRIFDINYGLDLPIEKIDLEIVTKWADYDADTRYPLLGNCVNMFIKNEKDENVISQYFISLLIKSPNKLLFFGDFSKRLHPGGWCGSLRSILILRRSQVLKLKDIEDTQVCAWVDDIIPKLDLWIEQQGIYERAEEGTFE